MQIGLSAALGASTNDLVLHVGTEQYAFADATFAPIETGYGWFSNFPSWADGDAVCLALTVNPPVVSSVEITSGSFNGFYAIDARIEATVTFGAAVDITGTPQLELDFDGTPKPANCTAATNTSTMVCAYTVAVNDSAPNGIAIAANKLTLNGGTITATGSTTLTADLDHGAVAIDANHKVDGIRPTLVTTGTDAPTTSTDGTQVILTFSENLGSVDRTKITIGIGGGNVAQTSAARVAGTKVELDLSTVIDATVMLTVALDLTAVEDGASNDILAVPATPVINAITDNAPPAFSAATATRSVPENTAANTNIGTALPAATDTDNDPLTYTLEGADAASFGFDAATRQLSTKSGVTYDRETQSSYAVTLKADDGNGGSDTIAVTITLTNVIEPPGRPAAPSVSSVAGSTTSLSVMWTAPENTGPAIDTYDLRYRQGTSGSWINGPQNVSSTSATISGLTANTLYQVQVLATSSEGGSPWSPSGSGQTNTAGNTAPTFPSSTATRSVAENSAAGTNVGAPVTATDADSGDTLTYTLDGTDAASFDIVSISGQIQTTSGVTYDHETKSSYAVIVKADDGNGGTDTVTVTIDLTDDVDERPLAPAAPRVTATPDTTDSLTVSWSAPSNTGRPAIDDYDLQYREGTTGNWTNGPQGVSGTSATIAGLTAAPTAYQVQVRATNGDGDGPWSPPGRIRTTPPPPAVGPPSPPRNLTAMAGDQAVQLSWSRPVDDGGARIVRYEYRQREGDGPVGEWQIIWEDPPPTDHTVTGLMNGVSYTFQVRAVNSRHASPPSETASATPEPELEPFEVAIVGVPDVAVAGESYELTAQSDEASLVYAWRVAWGGTIEPDDAQMVVWTAPETAVVAWIRVDATREDGATAGQSVYVRVEVPEPEPEPEPEPVPALPLLGHLLLALGLTAAGARLLSRRPRVPPAA